MDQRAERIGHNEAVFRDVNERIEVVAESFGLVDRPLDFMCECGNASCMAAISMTQAEYEELRSDPRQFAVVPGHEIPDVEEVVQKRKGYDIIRKHEGLPTKLAED